MVSDAALWVRGIWSTRPWQLEQPTPFAIWMLWSK